MNVPRPDTAAGDRRYFAVLELLATAHRVDLFVTDRPADPAAEARYAADLRAVGVTVLTADTRGWLGGACRRRRYDLGLFEFWSAAADYADLFRRHQPWAKVVVDSVDVHFLREEAAARLGLAGGEEVARRRDREVATYRAADAVVAASEDDRVALEQVGARAVYTVPIIVPVRPRAATARRPGVVFVGGFKHAPNADGLLWFAREVWPAVRAGVPGATLTVVGSSPPPEVLALDGRDGVSVAGYVPDTAPYLDRAAVSVAPLRYGAGMKGKVSEALACGLPVVTTAVGAQGFGIVSGEHAVVADDPAGFAAGVVRLLADPAGAERIGAAGQRLVAGVCSPGVVAARLEDLVARVVPGTPRPGPSVGWRVRSVVQRVGEVVHRACRRVGGAP